MANSSKWCDMIPLHFTLYSSIYLEYICVHAYSYRICYVVMLILPVLIQYTHQDQRSVIEMNMGPAYYTELVFIF